MSLKGLHKVGGIMKKRYFILGITIIVYIIVINIVSASKIAFSGAFIAFALYLILYSFKGKEIFNYIKSNKILNIGYKLCRTIVIAILCGLIAIEGLIIMYPKHDTADCDYVLVLGAGLRNGVEPSLTLANRLDAACEYINANKNTGKIVVSGGQGSDERLSEAAAMKKYLINKGIPEDNILMEDKSSTTSENFKFSKDVIEKDSGKSLENLNIKIVTTTFHAFRSNMLAKRNGYENVSSYCGKTVYYLIPVNYVRESFAVVKSFIFDK